MLLYLRVAPQWPRCGAICCRWPNISLKFGPTFIEAASSGDLAYELGTYTLAFDKDGKRIEDKGKYVVVWKRIGSVWKAAADILNSDLPTG